MRVRTIPKAVAEIKAKDPDTEINAFMLRHWVKTGAFPSIPCPGTKVLINLDELEAFLSGGKRNVV